MAQRRGLCLPMQDTRVQSLVWEDPTCSGATKPSAVPSLLSLCSRVHELKLLSPRVLETVLPIREATAMRSHSRQKSAQTLVFPSPRISSQDPFTWPVSTIGHHCLLKAIFPLVSRQPSRLLLSSQATAGLPVASSTPCPSRAGELRAEHVSLPKWSHPHYTFNITHTGNSQTYVSMSHVCPNVFIHYCCYDKNT